jgi:hypothetical protein
LLRERVAQLKPRSLVVIDEIQKVPALLDEVHALIEGNKLGASASGCAQAG